ncbi:MAG: molybdopterin synthase catalytic subunit [Bacteriovoracaceae bacterium]|jgi:molybdopterin synthase catalytic subunit
MFKMTENNINSLTNLEAEILENPTVGGIVYFQGVVRNHNEGKSVKSLEYEAYIPMANKIGQDILKKAKEKFDIVDAFCIHRVGHLAINDTAVWVITTSHHRKEAYDASQFIIDTVKGEVPIWKKEHYVHEEPIWVACHRCNEQHELLNGNHQHGK